MQHVTKNCLLKLNCINKNNRLIHKTKVLLINEKIFSRILQKNAYPLATVVDNVHKNLKNVAKGNFELSRLFRVETLQWTGGHLKRLYGETILYL